MIKAIMNTLLLCVLLLTGSQVAAAQQTFDPATDTIAVYHRFGDWEILPSNAMLAQSAQLVSPLLTHVQTVKVQEIHGNPYLFLRGIHRDNHEVGYTVMVQLQEVAPEIWKAGEIFQACWGDRCSECGFDEYWGCACERYDGMLDETGASFCNHMIAIGMGLARIDQEH